MDRIWAPWRIQYILGDKRDENGECIFCAKPRSEDLRKELVLLKRDKCYVCMNLYPYNAGHLMVCPYQHAHCITELDAETNAEVMAAAQLMLPVLRSVMNCQGFNIGYNIGKAAGAGIEEHLHLHIIPRWAGDSNILPVLSDTRVISEHIEETWERLRRGLAEHGIADSPNRA